MDSNKMRLKRSLIRRRFDLMINFPHFLCEQEVADGIQDLLISMEMLFAAIAFTYSFSIADFEVYEKRTTLPIREVVPLSILENHSIFQDVHLRNTYPRIDLASDQNFRNLPQIGSNSTGIEGDIQSTLLAAEQSMGGWIFKTLFLYSSR